MVGTGADRRGQQVRAVCSHPRAVVRRRPAPLAPSGQRPRQRALLLLLASQRAWGPGIQTRVPLSPAFGDPFASSLVPPPLPGQRCAGFDGCDVRSPRCVGSRRTHRRPVLCPGGAHTSGGGHLPACSCTVYSRSAGVGIWGFPALPLGPAPPLPSPSSHEAGLRKPQ